MPSKLVLQTELELANWCYFWPCPENVLEEHFNEIFRQRIKTSVHLNWKIPGTRCSRTKQSNNWSNKKTNFINLASLFYLAGVFLERVFSNPVSVFAQNSFEFVLGDLRTANCYLLSQFNWRNAFDAMNALEISHWRSIRSDIQRSINHLVEFRETFFPSKEGFLRGVWRKPIGFKLWNSST